MKILVLNCRIYSVEFELIEMPEEKILCKGVVDKIGLEIASIVFSCIKGKGDTVIEPILNHFRAVERILQILTDETYGVIKDKSEINAVGHRVIHGGEKFTKSVFVDDEVRKEIHKNIELAPLHNPYNLKGVDSVMRYLPDVPQVAVFDTSFYQSIPDFAFLYAIPYRIYQQYNIRKYGFHGISHCYTMTHTAHAMKVSPQKINMISCHLGAGCSITAIKKGSPVDTSMGFSPLDGLIMSTRCGDIDPEIVLYLMKTGWTLNEVETTLNRESGILGISGVSDDMRDIVKKMEEGDDKARLAVDMFVYRIQKYIGSYYGILGGIDAISFTAGIGENSPYIRDRICTPFEFLGIKIDKSKNNKMIGKEGPIHKSSSKVKIFCIPRNIRLLVARETADILKQKALSV